MCSKGTPPIPIPGVSIGFWEPVRLVDITRTPYCMVNLGGVSLGSDMRKISSYNRSYVSFSEVDVSRDQKSM